MTAIVVAVANQKGGVGKSTTSISIASALAEMEKKVIVVDADPQNTVVQWAGTEGEDGAVETGGLKFPVANLASADKMIHREIKKYLELFDYIIVDCPPSVEDDRPAVVLLVSDIVVMPTSSSPTDFWSSRSFVRLVDQARVTNERLKAVWLLNKLEEKRMLNKSILKAIAQTGIPLLKATIGNRECYKQAAALGVSVFDMNDRGAKSAAAEVREVTAELLAHLAE